MTAGGSLVEMGAPLGKAAQAESREPLAAALHGLSSLSQHRGIDPFRDRRFVWWPHQR
jgi:hypothetical protein